MLKRMLFCLGCWALGTSAGAWAQSADHLGGKIFAPLGVVQGGGTQFFVPGGTVFRNPDGSLITVPTQAFTPYPLTGQQFMQLTLPEPGPGTANSESDTWQEIQDRAQGKYGGRGLVWTSIEDINFGSMLEPMKWTSEDSQQKSGSADSRPTGPGFNPVPPSDMPTPSVDEVREEIG